VARGTGERWEGEDAVKVRRNQECRGLDQGAVEQWTSPIGCEPRVCASSVCTKDTASAIVVAVAAAVRECSAAVVDTLCRTVVVDAGGGDGVRAASSAALPMRIARHVHDR
jgi:hypothetical protein